MEGDLFLIFDGIVNGINSNQHIGIAGFQPVSCKNPGRQFLPVFFICQLRQLANQKITLFRGNEPGG